mmetsp:Transcript_67846/g.183270  ORF Transcript_67846/g.183270 Transcript_67846/m.183270 type:complete len:230 (-) Transcript_67846:47-736(-)
MRRTGPPAHARALRRVPGPQARELPGGRARLPEALGSGNREGPDRQGVHGVRHGGLLCARDVEAGRPRLRGGLVGLRGAPVHPGHWQEPLRRGRDGGDPEEHRPWHVQGRDPSEHAPRHRGGRAGALPQEARAARHAEARQRHRPQGHAVLQRLRLGRAGEERHGRGLRPATGGPRPDCREEAGARRGFSQRPPGGVGRQLPRLVCAGAEPPREPRRVRRPGPGDPGLL